MIFYIKQLIFQNLEYKIVVYIEILTMDKSEILTQIQREYETEQQTIKGNSNYNLL